MAYSTILERFRTCSADVRNEIILTPQHRHGGTKQNESCLIALTRASQRPMMPVGIAHRLSNQYPNPGAGPLAHAPGESV